jgi:hypothetical protein|tara:strand:- start:717 stop:920 length:204 start_codon:yes stop_codon:yes gene_type:complete
MKLIDTPNPNAKKILIDQNKEDIAKSLEELKSILSVFIGPDFITVTKEDNFEWEVITEDIVNIFDKL